MPCLADCYNPNEPCIKKAINAESIAPFVRMYFPSSGNPPLTVSNQSNPPFNFAVIKSFQYGASDGNGAEVEIYDEEGGSFQLFINKLVKTQADANDILNFGCQVEWGWIPLPCNGSNINQAPCKSSLHNFLVLSVVMNYSANGILFKLELLDTMTVLFDTRSKPDIGNCNVEEAIRQVFREATPSINNIVFLSADTLAPTVGVPQCANNLVCGGGNKVNDLSGWDQGINIFEESSRGNAESWQCNGMNPLSAVREWLSKLKSTNGKGFIVFWNSTANQLVIMEDPTPRCWADQVKARSIGTYIVNGGNDSPVLRFDPQVKFTFATAARGGGYVDTQSTRAGVSEPADPNCPEQSPKEDPPGSGDSSHLTTPNWWHDLHGNRDPIFLARAVAANELANKLYENIEAELTIQGDPNLDDVFSIKTKTVALWVINPFHLLQIQNDRTSCPIWTYLVGPPCNPILSNQAWCIKGVSHEVKEGSYTTTLRLYLPAPCNTVF